MSDRHIKPDVPAPQPTLSPFDEAKLRKMAELFRIADNPAYRAARAREMCLARMLDLVEGRVAPTGSADVRRTR